MKLNIEVDNSSDRVYRFLISSNEVFFPPLSSRLDLQLYSRKLGDNATNIFVVYAGIDIGHVGFYVNDDSFRRAFISSIATLPGFERRGVGRALLSEVLCHCIRRGMKSISLQVQPENNIAINLYKKFGFKYDHSGINLMTLYISDFQKMGFQ